MHLEARTGVLAAPPVTGPAACAQPSRGQPADVRRNLRGSPGNGAAWCEVREGRGLGEPWRPCSEPERCLRLRPAHPPWPGAPHRSPLLSCSVQWRRCRPFRRGQMGKKEGSEFCRAAVTTWVAAALVQPSGWHTRCLVRAAARISLTCSPLSLRPGARVASAEETETPRSCPEAAACSDAGPRLTRDAVVPAGCVSPPRRVYPSPGGCAGAPQARRVSPDFVPGN